MGTGTDVAMESAEVTLVKGDLRGIVRARRLSRATMRNIRQNLLFAFIYNVAGVRLRLAFCIRGSVAAQPMIASAAMTFSSVCPSSAMRCACGARSCEPSDTRQGRNVSTANPSAAP